MKEKKEEWKKKKKKERKMEDGSHFSAATFRQMERDS